MQSIAKTIFQKIGYGVSGTLYNASYESGSKDPNYPDPNLPHDREQCLNLFVNMVDIALEPIIWEEGHNISNAIRPIRAQLKANTCLFFHASIFTYYSLNPDIGVLIEFGTYDKHRAGEYHSRVYYLNEEENGLRFAGVTKEQYIAYRSKSKGTEFFECHVKNPMTVGQLLGKVQSRYSWTSDDYNLLSQNCQNFVGQAIKELGAYREKNQRKGAYDKTLIPSPILSELEKNEKDVTEMDVNNGNAMVSLAASASHPLE